jgi:hypothetical protein
VHRRATIEGFLARRTELARARPSGFPQEALAGGAYRRGPWAGTRTWRVRRDATRVVTSPGAARGAPSAKSAPRSEAAEPKLQAAAARAPAKVTRRVCASVAIIDDRLLDCRPVPHGRTAAVVGRRQLIDIALCVHLT